MYRTYHAKLKKTLVMLAPGEYYTTAEGEIISTMVGSCIATCIFDEKYGIGGMNHFMLPGVVNPQNLLRTEAGRYGMFAMEILIGELIKMGGDRKKFRAKIFGGSNIVTFRKTDGNIPQANIDFARKFLELEGIPILAEDVGGNKARRVLFFTDTNKVLVKPVVSAQAITPVEKAETRYKVKILRKRLEESGLTLFS